MIYNIFIIISFPYNIQRPIVSFSIEDRAAHNLKMKRLKKSQDNNPLFKSKKLTRKEKRQKKKEGKDVKPKFGANSTQAKSTPKPDTELPAFSGTVAEKGHQFKARPRWQMKEESLAHTQQVHEQKKVQKRKREIDTIRKEKQEIDRPKKGKGKTEIDSSLVNKYLKMLHSNGDKNEPKAKRSKWYEG